MGFLSRFEGRMEDTFEGAADKMFDAPISPVQIAKKAEKQMRREKMVGAGKQYAPTLYTVLVNPDDDRRLMGYYPTLAGETETYLTAKASEQGLVMDGQPLVRFIVDEDLKHGKFDIIAEAVAAPIIAQLRAEEMHRYGLAAAPAPGGYGAPAQPYPAPQPQPQAQPRMAAETVVFAGGQQAATPMPAQAAVRARLIDTTNNRAYDLASARLLIGRESKNDIAVHDVNASRTHAELRFEPQGVWTITDLGSTNGTLVNGREVATQPLSEGDRITIGMTNFMFTQA